MTTQDLHLTRSPSNNVYGKYFASTADPSMGKLAASLGLPTSHQLRRETEKEHMFRMVDGFH